jgi:hypothetical protein
MTFSSGSSFTFEEKKTFKAWKNWNDRTDARKA